MTKPEGTWKLAARRPAPPICGLVDGRVLHVADQLDHPANRAWLYDPTGDSYFEIAPPSWRAWNPYAIGTAEGWVAVLGGSVDHKPTARCSVYEPASNTWHEMPPMPEPRQSHQLALAGGRIYVISGEPANNDPRSNVWSWAPGEDWRSHPELPETVGLRYLAACGLADGSLVVWSKWAPHTLVRFDGERWTTLATLDDGAEILATETGLLVIGGGTSEHTHGRIQAWSTAGWDARPDLFAPRCYADARRLADGRTVVLAGQRHARYMRETSSGGELDLEYRSFSKEEVYGLVDCSDLELETPAGWVSLATPIGFGSSCVIHALSDGRLLVAQRYTLGLYADRPSTYVWTPPP